MPIYDKPVWQLMYEMADDIVPEPGQVFTRRQVLAWFAEHYPKVKESTVSAHLIRQSTNARSRVHYNNKPGDDDLFFQIDGSHFRRYEPGRDPPPIYEGSIPEDVVLPDVEEAESPTEFAYEADLRNFLAKNLHLLEPELVLFEDEEGITGLEFLAGGRYIDILAVDANRNYVVIELKVSRGYDRVVGQILRYIGWVKQRQAESGQEVRGFIVCREISEDLLLACSDLPQIELFEYELSVNLRKIA